MNGKIRRRYIFHGEVQGVGFRYRAYYLAERYGLTGFVKNEMDGTVLMEIEGEKEMISEVIMKLSEGRFIEITDMEVTEIPTVSDRSFYRL